ncbi:MAG: Abi-alpha family protein [Methylococcaceae bacterium]
MGWLEDIVKVLPVEKVYDDLAAPAFKEIGEAARNTIKASRFILAPIDYLAAQHERWMNFLKRVNNKVPEANLIPAHPQLSGQVLEGLKFLEENSLLAELFLNLLARSIDKERSSEAHPAFATIISQLSPDEALMIFHLSQKERLIKQYAPYNQATDTFSPKQLLVNEFPINSLIFPQNFFMYSDHLHSLNIGGIWQHGNQESIFSENIQVGVNITSYVRLTDFGQLFAKACLPEGIEGFNVTTIV